MYDVFWEEWPQKNTGNQELSHYHLVRCSNHDNIGSRETEQGRIFHLHSMGREVKTSFRELRIKESPGNTICADPGPSSDCNPSLYGSHHDVSYMSSFIHTQLPELLYLQCCMVHRDNQNVWLHYSFHSFGG